MVEEPPREDGDEESSDRQHDLCCDKVEHVEKVLAKESIVLERPERQRTKHTNEAADDGDYPSRFLAGEVELLMQVERHHLMHGDGRGEGGQRQQHVEHQTQHRGKERYVSKGIGKHIGQGDEDEAGACIGLYAHRKGGGEDDETCQDGYQGVYAGDGEGRVGQLRICSEVGGVGAEATHAKAQRIECLA